MLLLRPELVEEIKRHAERDYPNECCGLLIGIFGTDGRKNVTEILQIENAREAGTRRNRSLILPGDLLRAERHAAGKDLEVVGNYHSHPDATAYPSQYDLEHALPVWSYLIVSVNYGLTSDYLSWELKADRSVFNLEICSIVEQEKQ